MGIELLKFTRLVIPGVIAIAFSMPYVVPSDLKKLSELLSGEVLAFLGIVAIVFGGIYYSFDFRRLLWRSFVKRCHENVARRLTAIASTDPILRTKLDQVTDERAMVAFYHFVDTDSSLSEQASRSSFLRCERKVMDAELACSNSSASCVVFSMWPKALRHQPGTMCCPIRALMLRNEMKGSLQPSTWMIRSGAQCGTSSGVTDSLVPRGP